MQKKPELLAPAGSLKKLKTAFIYGADAVYVGNSVFGLRKYSQNLSLLELKQGLEYAHNLNKKVYLAINGYAHDSDLKELENYLKELNTCSPHALIIADIGVLQLAKQTTNIPIHISTQASTTNLYGCKLCKKNGAKRVILAREVPLKDCTHIKNHLDIELEIFIHGAMCAGYSGKCVMSNYTSARDANRGGCVQNCRHLFSIENKESTHLMNSKDLMTIKQIPEIIKSGIDSVKIEGRMKSELYVANTTSIYRDAIDICYEAVSKNQKISKSKLTRHQKQLQKVSNRTFYEGCIKKFPPQYSINYNFGGYQKKIEFLGSVIEIINNKNIIVAVKAPFKTNDKLEILCKNLKVLKYKATKIKLLNDQEIEKTRPNMVVKLPFIDYAHKGSILTARI
jgi:U32 family peptidase